MATIRVWVENLCRDNARRFEDVAAAIDGVTRVETWKGKAEIDVSGEGAIPKLAAALKEAGFSAEIDGTGLSVEGSASPATVKKVSIGGMTCRSCEITIERKFKRLPGVKKVDADAARGVVTLVCEGCEPDTASLQNALKGHEYTVRGTAAASGERPSLLRLAGLFAAVLLLGSLLKKLGLFSQGYSIGGSTNFAAAVVIGLVAGSSSCIAVSGGLLLSSAAKYNERYGGRDLKGRMKPVFLFVAGRVASYAVLGGLIGLLGAAFTPSPLVTGSLTVLAAVFMLVMGMDMLKIAPQWLKELMPRMPKSLSHRVMDAEGREHPAMPFALGAGTFFLPCGFTQALQLYALTVGSFAAGAAVLGGFALGTAPALLALGWASSSLKGKAGQWFFQFAGALVVILGIWNVQNGLTIAGYPLPLPSFDQGARAAAAAPRDQAPPAPVEKGKQVIKMDVGGPNGAYYPDTLTVKAGQPVRWEINGINVNGCIAALVSRKFGVNILLKPGLNVVEFTPDKPGSYAFSCSMGMFRGTIKVTS